MTRLGVLAIVLAVGLFACKEKPAGAAAAIGDREWALVALGDQKDPVGNGGERVTLRFDLEDSRVSGFGGCNRYTGPYTMTGEKLEFGPIAATKMFCEQGIEVEDKYLPALGSVQSWELAGAELVLKAAGVVVLRFKPL
jgi:heat shock protein HslJ